MQIIQLSTTLPKKEWTTEDLMEKFPCDLPESVKQNILNLGVSKRHLIKSEPSNSETVMSEDELVNLCVEACRNAVERAELSIESINYFITTYDATPFLSPGLSQILMPKLGLNPYVKYINAQGIASTAFPKALDVASNYLVAHPEDNVLICVSGVSSHWFQRQVHALSKVMEISQIGKIQDEATRREELRKWVATMQFFLFGDGVAAAVVSNKKKGLSVKQVTEVTNLREKDYMAGYSRLTQVNEPFKFGFFSHLDRDIPKLGAEYTELALKKLLGKETTKMVKVVKKWAIHTGSEKILNTLAEHHGIDCEKLDESRYVLREFGNLAGASLPFILERIISSGELEKDDLVLMLGYGWGFSAAACLLQNTWR